MIALGCVADDFTGATDVAAALRRNGMSVTLLFGLPDEASPPPETDSVVVALKTRTVPAGDAVSQARAVLAWLLRAGVGTVYFKYCSTFDSTDEGNIGPVTDALLHAMGESLAVVCPASPEHGRTTYQGHHFVDDRLLSDSPMRHHPLTPMTDPDLRRVLSRQTDGAVGHLPLTVVRHGSEAVAAALKGARADGFRHVVADALSEEDLLAIAAGSGGTRLLTGGAGLAGALGASKRTRAPARSQNLSLPSGPGIALAGSCSTATLAQVAAASEVLPSYRLAPETTPDPDELIEDARTWLRQNRSEPHLLVYSSAGPDERSRARTALGPRTPQILEQTLAELAREAVALGAARVVVAGGETSGAVVRALGVGSVAVAHEEDRGVPWCLANVAGRSVALLLKSGNFGGEDLLVRALRGAAGPSTPVKERR
ncbi:3-oxo-tetronate kinase [Streptomyces sp. NPDC058665]|uniref:3-oxo-tetronate kinase n=1 Tax=Streptomyces sp. NPDC058665 TaxID=3346586 RepID=UPI003653E71D